MTLTDLAAWGVELAKNITAITGDLDASAILSFVKDYLGNINLASLADMILKIIAVAQ